MIAEQAIETERSDSWRKAEIDSLEKEQEDQVRRGLLETVQQLSRPRVELRQGGASLYQLVYLAGPQVSLGSAQP